MMRNSDWLKFIHISRYKLKIKLILRLRKRGDQVLNLISTMLKFSAQVYLKLEQNLLSVLMILFIFPFTLICALPFKSVESKKNILLNCF